MRDTVFRWVAGFICLLLLAVPTLLPPPTVEDSATEQAMLPPCDVEDGIPFIQEEQITCYWGMSQEILSLPKAIDALNVDVSVSWVQSGVWIGIAEASEAEKFDLSQAVTILKRFSNSRSSGSMRHRLASHQQPTLYLQCCLVHTLP